MFLGKGTYGNVYKKGEHARKKFKKLSHIIQEYVAIKYLSDCPYIVNIHKVNFETLDIYMTLHEMNMRDWLNGDMKSECGKVTFKNKMILLRDILIGLTCIHELGLAHGDIKPSNILVDCDKDGKSPKALIGDLGFVSIAKYAKVERTAQLYRDIEINHHQSHDIYSLGIIMLEMFGKIRLRDQPKSYRNLHSIIRKEISNKDLAELIVKMTLEDFESRPSAKWILKEIFEDEEVEYIKKTDLEPILEKINIEEKTDRKIYEWMRKYSEDFDLKRGKRGYYGLKSYLHKNNDIDRKEVKLYSCAMLIIISSLFGRTSTFSITDSLEKCRKYGNYTREDVISCIRDLLDDVDVINILMTPS